MQVITHRQIMPSDLMLRPAIVGTTCATLTIQDLHIARLIQCQRVMSRVHMLSCANGLTHILRRLPQHQQLLRLPKYSLCRSPVLCCNALLLVFYGYGMVVIMAWYMARAQAGV